MSYYDKYESMEEFDCDNLPLSKNNIQLDEMKQMDRGYNKIYKSYINENGIKKKLKIEYYSSGDIGSPIRDAVTGERYQSIVGSLDEDEFFTIRNPDGKSRTKLFYISPDEFEKHQKINLNSSIRSKWEEKQLKRRISLIRQNE